MATDVSVVPASHPPAGGDELSNKLDRLNSFNAFWRQLVRAPAAFGAVAGIHFAMWAGLSFERAVLNGVTPLAGVHVLLATPFLALQPVVIAILLGGVAWLAKESTSKSFQTAIAVGIWAANGFVSAAMGQDSAAARSRLVTFINVLALAVPASFASTVIIFERSTLCDKLPPRLRMKWWLSNVSIRSSTHNARPDDDQSGIRTIQLHKLLSITIFSLFVTSLIGRMCLESRHHFSHPLIQSVSPNPRFAVDVRFNDVVLIDDPVVNMPNSDEASDVEPSVAPVSEADTRLGRLSANGPPVSPLPATQALEPVHSSRLVSPIHGLGYRVSAGDPFGILASPRQSSNTAPIPASTSAHKLSSWGKKSRLLHSLQQGNTPNLVFVTLQGVGAAQLLHNDGSVQADIMPSLAHLQSQHGAVTLASAYGNAASSQRSQVSMQTGGFLPLTGSSLAMKRSFNGTTLMSALGAAGYKTGLFTASDIDGDGMRAFVDSQGYTDVWARPTGDEYDGDAVDAALEWAIRHNKRDPFAIHWVVDSTVAPYELPASYEPLVTDESAPSPSVSPSKSRNVEPSVRGRRHRQLPREIVKNEATSASPSPPPSQHLRFLNALAYVDTLLLRLLAGIEELEGVADNTVVVVVGDRGQSFGIEFGDHTNNGASALFEENVKSFVVVSDSALGKFLQADYSGQEHTLEELIKRSQLLVEKPAEGVDVSDWQPKGSVTPLGVSPATVSHKTFSLADVTPSVLHLLGLDPAPSNSKLPAQSVVEQIRPGCSVFSESCENRVVYFVSIGPPLLLGLRDDRWKFIRNTTDGTTMLFDLETDGMELVDLARDTSHSQRVAVYNQLLKAWFVGTHCSYQYRLTGIAVPSICTSLDNSGPLPTRLSLLESLPDILAGPVFVAASEASDPNLRAPARLTEATTSVSFRTEWIPFQTDVDVLTVWAPTAVTEVIHSPKGVVNTPESHTYVKKWTMKSTWQASWNKFSVSKMPAGDWEFMLWVDAECDNAKSCEGLLLLRQVFTVQSLSSRPKMRAAAKQADRGTLRRKRQPQGTNNVRVMDEDAVPPQFQNRDSDLED